MRPNTADRAGPNEITILARVLGRTPGELSPELARHLLDLGFNDDEKNRMHDLAARNQQGGLSAAEKEELLAYANAGTLLSILKSKARRALRRAAKHTP